MSFNGTFDGKKHTIYNLHQFYDDGSIGFFGLTRKGITIRDLQLENVSISVRYGGPEGVSCVGAILGIVEPKYDELDLESNGKKVEVTMVGCKTSGVVFAPECYGSGGLIGSIAQYSNEQEAEVVVKIENCTNWCDIQGFFARGANRRS